MKLEYIMNYTESKRQNIVNHNSFTFVSIYFQFIIISNLLEEPEHYFSHTKVLLGYFGEDSQHNLWQT